MSYCAEKDTFIDIILHKTWIILGSKKSWKTSLIFTYIFKILIFSTIFAAIESNKDEVVENFLNFDDKISKAQKIEAPEVIASKCT